jgi:hypothetical protein
MKEFLDFVADYKAKKIAEGAVFIDSTTPRPPPPPKPKFTGTIEEYKRMLASHDWFYGMSDDFRVWKAGSAVDSRMRMFQLALDPDFEVWNQYAPDYYKFNK